MYKHVPSQFVELLLAHPWLALASLCLLAFVIWRFSGHEWEFKSQVDESGLKSSHFHLKPPMAIKKPKA
jgi:hypothetical protein